MKPASVAALKEVREKLAFWSTWSKTKKEWDTAFDEWCEALDSKRYYELPPSITVKAESLYFESQFDYIGAVDNAVAHLIRDLEKDTPEAEKQTLSEKNEEIIASSQEIRRLAETMQRFAPPTWCSEAEQLCGVLSGILSEVDGNGEAQT